MGLASLCGGLQVTFDYSSRRARSAALTERRRVSSEYQRDKRRNIQGNTSPRVRMPVLSPRTWRGVQHSLLKTCRYLQGSPRFNLWFTAQSALEDPRTHHQMKGEEMNEASFITSSLSIKARPYQRPPALLKTPQTDGQISSDRLIEFWQTAHKEKGDH